MSCTIAYAHFQQVLHCILFISAFGQKIQSICRFNPEAILTLVIINNTPIIFDFETRSRTQIHTPTPTPHIHTHIKQTKNKNKAKQNLY